MEQRIEEEYAELTVLTYRCQFQAAHNRSVAAFWVPLDYGSEL